MNTKYSLIANVQPALNFYMNWDVFIAYIKQRILDSRMNHMKSE